jgi:hypothetical protein
VIYLIHAIQDLHYRVITLIDVPIPVYLKISAHERLVQIIANLPRVSIVESIEDLDDFDISDTDLRTMCLEASGDSHCRRRPSINSPRHFVNDQKPVMSVEPSGKRIAVAEKPAILSAPGYRVIAVTLVASKVQPTLAIAWAGASSPP